MKKTDKVKVIGVDLGGSNVRVGLVCGNEIIATAKAKLPTSKEYDSVMQTIFACIDEIFTEDVQGIGVGVPSVVERLTGVVYNVQNIASWTEVPLKAILEQRYSRPAFINNDANCFALGERQFGLGQKYVNFVGLAIGTGIGGGIINNGKLLLDVNCGAGEFGEMIYLDSKFEDYCSGIFFINKHNTTGEEVFNLARTGNKNAQAICKEFGTHLGRLIYSIVLAIDPEAILLGGSISKAYDLYKDAVLHELKKFPYPRTIDKLVIECTTTSDIQILGSAALYWNAQ